MRARGHPPSRPPATPLWAAARASAPPARAPRSPSLLAPLPAPERGAGQADRSPAARGRRTAPRPSPAPPPADSGRAWVPLVILGIGLVVLLYSMQLGSVTTSGYDLQRLQLERNEWRQRNEQLLLELAKVQSLAWIEVEAVQRLGMRRAEHVSYLELAAPPAAELDRADEPAAGASPAQPAILALWRELLRALTPPLPPEGTR